jgi:hypothetical protein
MSYENVAHMFQTSYIQVLVMYLVLGSSTDPNFTYMKICYLDGFLNYALLSYYVCCV